MGSDDLTRKIMMMDLSIRSPVSTDSGGWVLIGQSSIMNAVKNELMNSIITYRYSLDPLARIERMGKRLVVYTVVQQVNI